MSSVLAPLGARYAYCLALPAEDTSDTTDALPAEVRAMSVILRIERAEPPGRTPLLEAAAAAALAVCLDERSAPGGEWAEPMHAWLDNRRPIATELYVIGCEYIPVAVSVVITASEGAPPDTTIQGVKEALRRVLDARQEFAPTEAPPHESSQIIAGEEVYSGRGHEDERDDIGIEAGAVRSEQSDIGRGDLLCEEGQREQEPEPHGPSLLF